MDYLKIPGVASKVFSESVLIGADNLVFQPGKVLVSLLSQMLCGALNFEPSNTFPIICYEKSYKVDEFL